MSNQRFVFVEPNDPDESILDMAAALLNRGGIIAYPTDTTYGFGANALDADAITRLSHLKGRPVGKPFHVAVANLEMAERFVVLNQAARTLAQKFLPGSLTLVLPKKETVPDVLVGGRGTLGIRIPDNKICLMLAQKAAIPIITTSANVSGGENPYTTDQIVKQFASQMDHIDLVIDQGPLLPKLPSTIIDLTTSPPTIIRTGPISDSELLAALG
jgi:L-threonylcarbamoyladenylate synthase